MMKKIFLDANIIDKYDSSLQQVFSEKNLVPVIGCNTMYENTACFMAAGKKQTAAELFANIRNSDPLVSIKREHLYALEFFKLSYGVIYNPFISISDWKLLEQQILDFSQGKIDLPAQQAFRDGREQCYEEKYTETAEDANARLFFKKYGEDFTSARDIIFEAAKNESSKIEWAKSRLECLFKNLGFFCTPTEDEIKKLLHDLPNYPLTRSFFYAHLYQSFLANRKSNNTGTIPKKFGLSDGVQILEAAYCDIFLTQDSKLVEKHVNNINPYIQVITLKDLYNYPSPEVNQHAE